MASLLHRDSVGSFLFTALTFPLATHLSSYIGGWQSIAEELSREFASFLRDFPTRLRNTLAGEASEEASGNGGGGGGGGDDDDRGHAADPATAESKKTS